MRLQDSGVAGSKTHGVSAVWNLQKHAWRRNGDLNVH